MLVTLVQYRLEIMAPGKSQGEPLAMITSDAPFMRIGRGELIDPTSLCSEVNGEFFKVLHHVHSFETLESGEMLQRTTIFTSKVYDCAPLRREWIRGTQ
jgi:hypothetical protein